VIWAFVMLRVSWSSATVAALAGGKSQEAGVRARVLCRLGALASTHTASVYCMPEFLSVSSLRRSGVKWYSST
jgi:hypothetical protein